MKSKIRIMCSICGKTFIQGNTNGMPNGVGFYCKDGTLINMCQGCLIDLGGMTEEEKDKFFKDHGIRK